MVSDVFVMSFIKIGPWIFKSLINNNYLENIFVLSIFTYAKCFYSLEVQYKVMKY